jgi:hypothetical protein
LPLYLTAARNATAATGRQLQVIVEIFQQVADARDFRAVPASIDRVERQLEVAGAVSAAAGPVAFSMPEYMTPLGGAAAERLFDDYRRRVLRASPD